MLDYLSFITCENKLAAAKFLHLKLQCKDIHSCRVSPSLGAILKKPSPNTRQTRFAAEWTNVNLRRSYEYGVLGPCSVSQSSSIQFFESQPALYSQDKRTLTCWSSKIINTMGSPAAEFTVIGASALQAPATITREKLVSLIQVRTQMRDNFVV